MRPRSEKTCVYNERTIHLDFFGSFHFRQSLRFSLPVAKRIEKERERERERERDEEGVKGKGDILREDETGEMDPEELFIHSNVKRY